MNSPMRPDSDQLPVSDICIEQAHGIMTEEANQPTLPVGKKHHSVELSNGDQIDFSQLSASCISDRCSQTQRCPENHELNHCKMSNIGAGDAQSADATRSWKEHSSLTGKDITPTSLDNNLQDSGSRSDKGTGDFCTDRCASDMALPPMTLDDLISEEVELTIKQVIEDSVQQVLVGQGSGGNHGNVDRRTLDALTNSMEESLQGMIAELNVGENEEKCMQQPRATVENYTKTGVEKCGNDHNPQKGQVENLENPKDTNVEPCRNNKFYHCSTTQTLPCGKDASNGKIDDSISSNHQGTFDNSDTPAGASFEEMENFRNWKEAGKALRIALSKFALKNEEEKASKLDISNSIQTSQSLESLQTGNAVNEVETTSKFLSSPILHPDHSPWANCPIQSERRLSFQDPENSGAQSNVLNINGYDQACLARSMQQSLPNDPMNQMWEDYKNTQVPLPHSDDTNKSTSIECCDINPPLCQETCKSTQIEARNDLHSFTNTKDPTLTELRERMRTLMSNLPISKNKSVLGSRENDSLVVSSDSGIVRSPKNARRRHYKPSKDTCVAESDEEMGSKSSQKLVSKTRSLGHKTADITKDSQIYSSQNRQCKFRKQTATKLNDTPESLPELVSDSNSDLNSSQDSYKDCLKTDQSPNTVHLPDQNTCDVGDHKNSHKKKTNLENSAIKHTESMLNFADVDSTESERVASKVETTSGSLGACVSSGAQCSSVSVSDDDDLPSLDSLSSTDEDEVAASILREKYKRQPEELDSSDLLAEEDFDLFGEMPDLVVSTDDTDEEYQEITLSCEDVAALQEINVSDSSLEEEEGIEGDDEFECDCNLCQRYQPTEANPITQDTTEVDDTEAEESRYFEDFSSDFRSMPSMDDVDMDGLYLTSFLNPFSLLTSETNRRGLLDLMFTNVIMHMLSVYPELLNDQTPEPLPPNMFEKFALIRISEEESQCPICLCTFELGEEAKQLPCDHVFHSLCIQAWLSKARTCPVCRHILTNPSAELPGS